MKNVMIQESQWSLTVFYRSVSDMTAKDPNSVAEQAYQSTSKRLLNRSFDLVSESKRTVHQAREIKKQCQILHQINLKHVHKCMACKFRWECPHHRCELRYLSLCFDCHRRIGSRF